MSACIIDQNGSEITLQIKVNLDSKSMLKCEDRIASALNEAGCLATGQALSHFETDGTPILIGDTKLTSRGKIHNTYQGR